jgi:hypothetical protein
MSEGDSIMQRADDDAAAPEPQLWKGLYTLVSAFIALVGSVPAIVAWAYWSDPAMVSWKMLAIILTLVWMGFFGTPWMVWAFARRWLAWRLGEQERARRRYERAMSDRLDKAIASFDAPLGEDLSVPVRVQGVVQMGRDAPAHHVVEPDFPA